MEEVAINNLKVLTHPTKLAANQYVLRNNEMITNNDSFDTIYSLDDLEYPIYFTFHQLLNHVHTSYDNNIHGYTRKELINLMIDALDNLMDYYESTDMKNINFGNMLDDIDDKVFFVQQYYRYGWCLWLPTFMKLQMNKFCRGLINTSKEVHNFYYESMIKPYEWNTESDADSDSESGAESNVETEEESDDIPDLDETNHPKED